MLWTKKLFGLTTFTSLLFANAAMAVYGGELVPKQNPVGASIVGIVNLKTGGICTGSILSQDLILTAAHCLSGKASDYILVFGHEMTPSQILVKPTDMITHENYTTDLNVKNRNDIALMRFSGGLPQGFKVAWVLASDKNIRDNDIAISAGFGVSRNILQSGPGQLRKINLRIEDAHFSETEVTLDNGFFKGICTGDSGGPTYLLRNGHLYLFGVTSRAFGPPLVPCANVAMVTKVTSYFEWIRKTAKKMREKVLPPSRSLPIHD